MHAIAPSLPSMDLCLALTHAHNVLNWVLHVSAYPFLACAQVAMDSTVLDT